MAIGNPTFTQQGGSSWFEALQGDPDFQKMSPQSQQILAQWGQRIDAEGQRAVQEFQAATKSDPQLQQVMAEAKQSGATDHPMSPLMKALTIATVGLVTAGALAPAIAGIGGVAEGAADSSYIGADVASTAGAAEGGGGIAGALGPILNSKVGRTVSAVAPILGNMAKSGAEANAQRDRILPSMESVKLARDKYALDAPGTRMSQSTKASILKSASPTKVNWGGPGSGLKGQVPTFTGGFSGALANIDPRTKALADEVMDKDLRDQLAGQDSQTKYLDQFGHESVGDKLVGGLATGTAIWDAISGTWKPKSGTNPNGLPTPK